MVALPESEFRQMTGQTAGITYRIISQYSNQYDLRDSWSSSSTDTAADRNRRKALAFPPGMAKMKSPEPTDDLHENH
jgi:hypothetical protein